MGIGLHGRLLVVSILGGAGIILSRRRSAAFGLLAVLVGAGLGGAAAGRAAAVVDAAVPAGPIQMTAVAVADPIERGGRPVVVAQPLGLQTEGGYQEWAGPLLLVEDPPPDIAAGEPLVVHGSVDPGGRIVRGRPVAGVVRSRHAVRLGPAINPALAVGNSLRRHVLGSLDAARASPSGALLAGFLIGDVSRLPESDNDALRSAGLSHFVAVSGSNVALFLAAWWVVGGPLGFGPRRRAVFGLVGLVVFTVVTRWEPSVVRASVMAGLMLIGRFFGRPITPWTALGGAAALSLVVAPELAGSAGFGLSVAATGGIIAGAPLWRGRRPKWVWTILGATVSAQVAVAPLLLMWFGTVPLMAPIANLLAAPIVSTATALGGVGAVARLEPLIDAGAALAGVVLEIARIAADLPQLGAWPAMGLAASLAVAVRFPGLRPPLIIGVVAAVALSVVPPRLPSVPTVHFLDVGQGDSTLFMGSGGEVILVDGGPDPDVLGAHLRRLGVSRIDLLVITHRHADHSGGLRALEGRVSVGIVWHPPQLGEGGVFDEVVAALASESVVEQPLPGDALRVGDFVVEVLGPKRRYAGPNDGSVVLTVEAAGRSVVMSGDVEVAAQSDLGPLRADLMKVPHQGAATSDLNWLSRSAPSVAVISVGPNDYGHPSPAVIRALEEVGAVVLRTDRHGTVTLPMDSLLERALRLASAG